MDRSKKSILIFSCSLINIFVTSICSLIIGRVVLLNLGSDYNGVNSTVNQVLSIVTLIEGGITTSVLIALFKPYMDHDWNSFNDILSTAKRQLYRIGIAILIFGALISIIYPLFIKSSINYVIIVIMFFLAVCTTAFRLSIINKYRVVFQVAQEEYILNFVTMISNICTQVCAYIAVVYTKNMIIVRSVYAIFSILEGCIVILISRRRYPFINYNFPKSDCTIVGTTSVIIGKITSTVNSSIPMLFLSTFVGTQFTSVYSIYNIAIGLVKNCLYSFANSPQNAIGQLIALDKREHLYNIMKEFETAVIMLTYILLSSVYVVIVPFVTLYTDGVVDVNYVNYYIPSILIISAVIEILHVPSGIYIYMSGAFDTIRKIQITSCFGFVLFSILGACLNGVYGILWGVLLGNLILAAFEIGYTKIKAFKVGLFEICRKIALFSIVFVPLTVLETKIVSKIRTTWGTFFLSGFTVVLLNFAIALLITYIFYRRDFASLFCRVKGFISGLIHTRRKHE